MGECSKETAFGMLDYFWENGGNFIDTYSNINPTLHSLVLITKTEQTTTRGKKANNGSESG
jgi:aryl-alcohol dehydrogenase-like predicted oxidoreductase